MLNERNDAFYKNHEFCFNLACNNFVLKEFTNSEIDMYIRNIRPNKSMRSDVLSIQFVKLSAKVICVNCLTNV